MAKAALKHFDCLFLRVIFFFSFFVGLFFTSSVSADVLWYDVSWTLAPKLQSGQHLIQGVVSKHSSKLLGRILPQRAPFALRGIQKFQSQACYCEATIPDDVSQPPPISDGLKWFPSQLCGSLRPTQVCRLQIKTLSRFP